ncbi:MAG: hypothetical protein AAGK32_13975, partial [Actinomycetota bacterium]
MFAQIDELGGKLTGLGAQVLAALLGAATLVVSIVVIWKLLASMLSNPGYDKLLAIVGVGLFVESVGRCPDEELGE